MKKKIDINKIYPVFLILVGLVLNLLNTLGLFEWLRSGISYIYTPISFYADTTSQNVKYWGTALTNASGYIQEYKELKEEMSELKSNYEGVILLEEENTSLKKQIELGNTESKYVLAKILDYSNSGNMRIDVGSQDGVKVGDIVVLGSSFVGVVSEVEQSGCLVRLPNNKSSYYEVGVIGKESDTSNNSYKTGTIKSSGVVSGNTEGIKLENINLNSEVKDGDIVILRDERIGEILVLGKVVGLENNPALTSKSGYVSSVYDFANLITVFVKVQ